MGAYKFVGGKGLMERGSDRYGSRLNNAKFEVIRRTGHYSVTKDGKDIGEVFRTREEADRYCEERNKEEGSRSNDKECPTCYGGKRHGLFNCKTCNGTGSVKNAQWKVIEENGEFNVVNPDGERMWIKGKGAKTKEEAEEALADFKSGWDKHYG